VLTPKLLKTVFCAKKTVFGRIQRLSLALQREGHDPFKSHVNVFTGGQTLTAKTVFRDPLESPVLKVLC